MLERVPEESPQVYGRFSHSGYNAAYGVRHTQLQWNEVEPVYCLPIIETADDFPVVPEIENGVELEIVIEAVCLSFNFSKTVFLTNRTDYFDFTIRIIGPTWYL